MNLEDYFPEYKDNPEKLKELKDYQTDLDLLAAANVSIQFTNKGKDHAIQVMSKIFDSAYKNIKIFARDFNGTISNNKLYLENLEAFLNKDVGNSMEVIFETNPNKDSKALGILRKVNKQNPGKVILKKANENQVKKFKEYLVNDEKMIHFIIADDAVKGYNKYRCETDTKKYIAILNFDDVKFCDQLLNLYKILEVNATLIA